MVREHLRRCPNYIPRIAGTTKRLPVCRSRAPLYRGRGHSQLGEVIGGKGDQIVALLELDPYFEEGTHGLDPALRIAKTYFGGDKRFGDGAIIGIDDECLGGDDFAKVCRRFSLVVDW